MPNPTTDAWKKVRDELKQGKSWPMSLINRYVDGAGKEVMAVQVVHFADVTSLPVKFLESWLIRAGTSRLRLLPPYREHLSQAFARFFMRVGLPQDIELP